MSQMDIAYAVMFLGGILGTLGVQWVYEKIEGWAPPMPDHEFETYLDFIASDKSMYRIGDVVTVEERNQKFELKTVWMPVIED